MAVEPLPTTAATPVTISAKGVHYRALNARLRAAIRAGATEVMLTDVLGQRYIGTGIRAPGVTVHIHGVPGQDLGAFLEGPTLVVHGNAQDGVGNTMNEGRIEVHGQAGDVVGYGMRGGRILIEGDVGYRVGIHMKGYREKQPLIVIGGCAGNFLGEYMAGGCQVLLGMGQSETKPVVGHYCATGMHGGVMYLRGEVTDVQLGEEVQKFSLDGDDHEFLKPILGDFVETFQITERLDEFDRFVKVVPVSTRPYGTLYVY
jgi:glutamate synthase domain-containing protein 3